MKNQRVLKIKLLCGMGIWVFSALACARAFPTQDVSAPAFNPAITPTLPIVSSPQATFTQEIQSTLAAPEDTATPDNPKALPTLRTNPETYVIRQGDTLNNIARLYEISLESLEAANPNVNPNWLVVGDSLTIPVPPPQNTGADFKIIPDSELVYSPTSASFNIQDFINKQGGYLSTYSEKVDGEYVSGAQIIQRVASEYSVNPRVLLAVLEFQSQWVTSSNPPSDTLSYPIRLYDSYRAGLFYQISWAANNLNYGFYAWLENGASHWILQDGGLVPISPTINAGTAGVQALMATLDTRATWDDAVSSDGIFATYTALFGSPFQYSMDNLLPANLTQPTMHWPMEAGTTWYFTGGPHSAWGDLATWAALDFAPPEPSGCQISPSWATAVADGVIMRSWNGEVVLDLDGDGVEQTGWSVLYLHIAADGRLAVGTRVKAGGQIGHPSCEGGYSYGTHMHIARRYNGVWIAANGEIPFDLDGWASQGSNATEYDGLLVKGNQSIEAWDGRSTINEIHP
jgi:LysM repeat protein